MAVNEFGDIIPVPGTSGVSEVKPADILASYARFTQRGVTIASGSGVVPAGTVLGRVTATKKYVPYTDAGTHGAGSDTAVGVLRQDVDATSEDRLGNIVVSGILFNSKVQGETASAIADLNARVDAANDLFIF